MACKVLRPFMHQRPFNKTAELQCATRLYATSICIETAVLQCSSSPCIQAARCFLAQLYQRSGSECVLSVVVHHIAVDLWSLVVLIREFFELYRLLKETGSQPAPRDSDSGSAVEYVDYSEWERRLLADPASDEMLRYWMQVRSWAWPGPESIPHAENSERNFWTFCTENQKWNVSQVLDFVMSNGSHSNRVTVTPDRDVASASRVLRSIPGNQMASRFFMRFDVHDYAVAGWFGWEEWV
jgi:hypothetical protein